MAKVFSGGDSQKIDEAVFVCHHPRASHPRGIFFGENPLDFSFPLFLLEATFIILLVRSLHFLLKPLRQPHIVSRILGGIIVGPSMLGRNRTFSKIVFPDEAASAFKNIGLIGFVYFLFLSGVKMDVMTVAKTGKKQLSIGLIGVLVPFITVLTIIIATRKSLDKELTSVPVIGGVASAFAVTSFPVLYQIIKELNLLSSEVGKLAMSSVMVSDCVGVVCLVLFEASRFYFDPKLESINALWVVMSFVGIAALVGGSRQAMVWIVKSTPERKPVDPGYVVAIFVAVMVVALLSDMSGLALANAPLWLGLAVPDGPPLGAALVEGGDMLVTYVFMPFSYAFVGMYTDVSSMVEQWSTVAPLFLWVLVAYLTKVVTVLVVALFFEMPVRDGLALSLVMSLRGQVEILIFMHWMDLEIIQVSSFTMLIISSTVLTAVATPLISILYDPTRPYKVNKRRAIQFIPPNTELPAVACIHDQESLTGFLNLLEVCNPSVSSPFTVHALRLIELVGRAAPVFIDHEQQAHVYFDHSGFNSIHNALKLFQDSRGDYVKFKLFTTVSPTRTMYQDICDLALTKKAVIIILPYKKGCLETRTDAARPQILLRTVNCSVLAHAPCSVGVLVDSGPFRDNKIVNASMRRKTHRFAVLFLGGADAREAIAFADRMAGNVDVSLSVIRFLSRNDEGDDKMEKKLDDGLVTWFWVKNEGNDRVVYREVVVGSGEETTAAIRAMGKDDYDLWIVGRKNGINPVLLRGLETWSQNNELGVIGDFIVSTELGSRASVLVVQQQVLRAQEAASQATNFSTSSLDAIIHIPMLTGDNFSDWKDSILLKLGCLELDMALRVDAPPAPTDSSTPDENLKYERWERSNRLCLLYMKSHISKSIRGSIPETDNAKVYMKAIVDQFVRSDKALASTLMKRLSSKSFDSTKGVREHIMEMRDMAAQLKSLNLEISEAFLVHFILNSLPSEYGPFKISYNTHKDEWSVNEFHYLLA